jgi:hypothetical protein
MAEYSLQPSDEVTPEAAKACDASAGGFAGKQPDGLIT